MNGSVLINYLLQTYNLQKQISLYFILLKGSVPPHLRGSNSKKKNFVCFNAMQFIFGQVLGHGTTNIKISFSKLPLPWLPC